MGPDPNTVRHLPARQRDNIGVATRIRQDIAVLKPTDGRCQCSSRAFSAPVPSPRYCITHCSREHLISVHLQHSDRSKRMWLATGYTLGVRVHSLFGVCMVCHSVLSESGRFTSAACQWRSRLGRLMMKRLVPARTFLLSLVRSPTPFIFVSSTVVCQCA